MFGRSAPRTGQVLSHSVLQVQGMRQLVGPGGVLFKGRGVLLHRGLPAEIRDEVLCVSGLRRRRGKYSLPLQIGDRERDRIYTCEHMCRILNNLVEICARVNSRVNL